MNEKLIWPAMFAGLLLVAVGLALLPQAAGLAALVLVAGTVLLVYGVAGIWWRSRQGP